MQTTTPQDIAPVYPEIDFALADLPDFHERMDTLRDAGKRIVPVVYTGRSHG